MRFLGDMGVSWRLIEWLRAAGHDAVHLRDEGLHRLPNGEIFQKGFVEQRVVLTFDLDFGETETVYRIPLTRAAASPSREMASSASPRRQATSIPLKRTVDIELVANLVGGRTQYLARKCVPGVGFERLG